MAVLLVLLKVSLIVCPVAALATTYTDESEEVVKWADSES